MNYLLVLWLLYYQNFKRFHRVVFLEEFAIYHFWHIFFRFLSEYSGLHCAKRNSMTYSFFIKNYLLLLWLFYYQNFKRFHCVVFLEEGALYHFWHIFYRFLLRILRPLLCKNEADDIFFFHHELSSSAMLSLISKFQKISPCSFLRRGRFIPLLACFLQISLTNIEAFIVKKQIRWHILFSSWIIFLCYGYSIIKISKDFTV